MTLSRSPRQLIVGIVALLLLAALWMLITDERCSRNASAWYEILNPRRMP